MKTRSGTKTTTPENEDKAKILLTARKRRRLKDAWLMVSAAAFGPALSLRCAEKHLEETWA